MKKFTTIFAAIAAGLLLAACAKKEEAAVQVDVAPEPTPETAPADATPAEDGNSADAEQPGGDKVSEPEPPPAGT